MGFQNIGADGSTARLLKAAQGAQAAEHLPAASAKTLVAKCRAVRLYLESWNQSIALIVLDEVDKMMRSCEDDTIRKAFSGHTAEVRRHLRAEVTG